MIPRTLQANKLVLNVELVSENQYMMKLEGKCKESSLLPEHSRLDFPRYKYKTKVFFPELIEFITEDYFFTMHEHYNYLQLIK